MAKKLYEVLVTQEEMGKAIDLGKFFKIPSDNRNLNYDLYFNKGNIKKASIDSYHSHNTINLNVEEMKKLLLKLDIFKEIK